MKKHKYDRSAVLSKKLPSGEDRTGLNFPTGAFKVYADEKYSGEDASSSLSEEVGDDWETIRAVGSNLRRMKDEFLREVETSTHAVKKRSASESGMHDESGVDVVGSEGIRCLNSSNARFFEHHGKVLCSYYEVSDEGYDLHFDVFAPGNLYLGVKVNDKKLLKGANLYPPVFAAYRGELGSEVIFATLESDASPTDENPQPSAEYVFIKSYTLSDDNKGIIRERSIKLRGERTRAYMFPLEIAVDERGDVLVIAKAEDSRANLSDKVYVMWKLSGKDLSPVVRDSEKGGCSYLFRMPGLEHVDVIERITAWNAMDNTLYLTHIGGHITGGSGNYYVSYEAYSADIKCGDSLQSEDMCLVGERGCNIQGPGVFITNEGISLVSSLDGIFETGEIRCIAFLEQSRSGNPAHNMGLMVHAREGSRVLKDILRFEPEIISLNMKWVNSDTLGVIAASADNNIYMCTIPLSCILAERLCEIEVTQASRSEIDIEEFLHIARHGASLVPGLVDSLEEDLQAATYRYSADRKNSYYVSDGRKGSQTPGGEGMFRIPSNAVWRQNRTSKDNTRVLAMGKNAVAMGGIKDLRGHIRSANATEAPRVVISERPPVSSSTLPPRTEPSSEPSSVAGNVVDDVSGHDADSTLGYVDNTTPTNEYFTGFSSSVSNHSEMPVSGTIKDFINGATNSSARNKSPVRTLFHYHPYSRLARDDGYFYPLSRNQIIVGSVVFVAVFFIMMLGTAAYICVMRYKARCNARNAIYREDARRECIIPSLAETHDTALVELTANTTVSTALCGAVGQAACPPPNYNSCCLIAAAPRDIRTTIV